MYTYQKSLESEILLEAKNLFLFRAYESLTEN